MKEKRLEIYPLVNRKPETPCLKQQSKDRKEDNIEKKTGEKCTIFIFVLSKIK